MALTTLTTLTALSVTAFAAVSALATVTPVTTIRATTLATVGTTVAAVTVSTFAAGTTAALGLYIAFGLLGKGTHGKAHLAGLVVVLEELHVHLVADLQHVLDLLCLTPCDFANVEQAFLAGKDFDEGTEVQDAHDLAVIHGAGLGLRADTLDPLEGLLHCLCIVGGDVHHAFGEVGSLDGHLVDVDDGAGFLLDLLDGLASLADNGADELGRDADFLDARDEGL